VQAVLPELSRSMHGTANIQPRIIRRGKNKRLNCHDEQSTSHFVQAIRAQSIRFLIYFLTKEHATAMFQAMNNQGICLEAGFLCLGVSIQKYGSLGFSRQGGGSFSAELSKQSA
jgi:hypothetical protein